MYKFICANISKSRNFTDSYKKLAQTKKLHLNGGWSQPVLGKDLVEEELQECVEDDNGIADNSPTLGQKRPTASKVPSFKTPQTSPWKFREYPSFYTGNIVITEPPIPSISKKYYHLYSITAPSFSKRPYSSSKLTSSERNYVEAIEDIANIETEKRKNEFQFKPMDLTRFPSMDVNTKVSKKGKKIEISYPTHTVKHNLTLSKRFRIRQGSAEGKMQEMEAKIKKRKPAQKMTWKGLAPKTITYPKLMENVKKTRSNPVIENTPEELKYSNEDAANAEKNIELNIDKDFESLVKSHPTIEKASNEAKMRLKTKFIQLLLKSSKSANAEKVQKPVNTEPEQVNGNVIPENSEKNSESVVKMDEEASKNVKSHPTVQSDVEALRSSYARCRYPKRVWMDNINISGLNLEEVCIKDSVTKTGSGLITRHYGKETPKPNYEKIEQDAKELSGFVEKTRKIKKHKPKSDDLTLSGLKQEKMQLIKELDKLDVKFAEQEDDTARVPSTLDKVRKILTGQMGLEEPSKQQGDLEFDDDLKWEKSIVKGSKEALNMSHPKVMLKHNQQGNKRLEGPKASLYHTEKKVKKTDGFFDLKKKPKKCNSDSLEPEPATGRLNLDGKATDQNLTVRPSKSNKLEEPTKVEELNEQANEKAKIYKKKRKLQIARREFEELQSQIESLPSLKINNITPRIDKTQDRMEEKVEIAEKTKEVIEDIKREALSAVPKKKIAAKIKILTDKPVSSNKQPKSQQRTKRKIEAADMNAVEPTEAPKIKTEVPKIQEIDVSVDNAKKSKKQLDDFGEKKKKEWTEMLAQVCFGSGLKENEKEIKDTEQSSAVSAPPEGTENNYQSKDCQPELSSAPNEPDAENQSNICEKAEDVGEKTEPENTNQNIKEEQQSEESNLKSGGGGLSCSANHGDCFKRAKIVFHNVETILPVSHLNPGQNDVTLKVEEMVANIPPVRKSLADLNSAQRVEWLSVTKIVNSAKSTEQKMVPKAVYDKEIKQKPNNQEEKNTGLQCQSKDKTKQLQTKNLQALSPKEALKLFREQVLDKYFDTVVYPTVDETVYTPKERLVVNDIKEIEGAKIKKDHCKELAQICDDEPDSAVIRPGDEIVFVRKDLEENNQNVDEAHKEPSNLLEELNQNSNVANQLAVMESSILTETKKQIGEIMNKIDNLETMFREQQSTLGEKISGNKVRIPPPKPPAVLAKDQKNIKKEKPKGPNDIVLPPKVRGSVPDKSPEDLLQSNTTKMVGQTKPATEYNSYVLQDDQDAISDQEHIEKVRKYFVKKFGLTSGSKANLEPKRGSASTPALQIEAKCAESVAKTSKVHKSTCSISDSERMFNHKGSVNLEELKSDKLTYWSENRPISCSPVQHKPSKIKAPLRSSSADIQNSRVNDFSKNYLKAKYSTLSGPKRLSQTSTLPKVMKNIPLVVESSINKLNWRTTKRSASDDSRGESKGRVKSKSKINLKSKKSAEQKLEIEAKKSDVERVSWSKILKSNSSMTMHKRKKLTGNKSEVIELAATLQSSKTKVLCAADANLQQNDPVALLNVRLTPNEDQIKVTKHSAEKQLLSGKRGSNTDSVAGISTTSALNKSSGKNPKRRKGNQDKKSSSKKEKIAIFRLQPDGEVMIIKKADDVERKSKHKQENKKYIVYLTESAENVPEKKDVKGSQSTTVLLAKVEEILVKKPINKPNPESFHTSAFCDDLNDIFKSGTPRLTAKIETIYDKQSSVKIRETNRLKRFNSCEEIQQKPRAWKSVFGDVNGSRFEKVKDDFFQQIPKETFVVPQKAEQSPKPAIKQVPTAPPGKEKVPGDNVEQLNKKYALMLRNIEKRLAERRRMLEINKEQIEQINKILNLEPECEEPPSTEQLPQKQEAAAKPPTFSDLLRKTGKPKIIHNVQKASEKTDGGDQAKVISNLQTTKRNLNSNQDSLKKGAVEENKIFTQKNLIDDTILEVGESVKKSVFKNQKSEVTKPLVEVKKLIPRTDNFHYLNPSKAKDKLYKLDVPESTWNSRPKSPYSLKVSESRTTNWENVDIEESKLFAKKMLIYDTILEVGKSHYSASSLRNSTTLTEVERSEVIAAPKIPLINEIVLQKNQTELLNSFKPKSVGAVGVPQLDVLDAVKTEMTKTVVDQPKIVGNLHKLEAPTTQRKLNTLQTSNYVLKVGEPSKAEWKSVKVDENSVFAKKSLFDDTVLKVGSRVSANVQKTAKNKSKESQKGEEVATGNSASVIFEVVVQKKQAKLLEGTRSESFKAKKEVPKFESAKNAKVVEGTDFKVPKLSLPVEVMQRLTKKYDLEKDEQFMSVEKTKMKTLQESLMKVKEAKNPPSGNNHINIDQSKRPTSVITPTEQEQRARKEKLKRSTRKGRVEQNALRQKIKSKKDVVEEINTTAEELRRKQQQRKPYEIFKGTRRQEMYRHDAKVIQPSVGSCLWGNKLISVAPSDESKKEFHCSATKNNSDLNRLMSKSEFLELKRRAAKNRISVNLQEQEMLYNIREIQKNLTEDFKEDPKQSALVKEKSQSEINVAVIRDKHLSLVPKKTFSEEIYKYLSAKLRTATDYVAAEKAQSEVAVPKQQLIGDEIYNYLNAQPKSTKRLDNRSSKMQEKMELSQRIENELKTLNKPMRQLSEEELRFKVTQMAIVLAKNVKLDSQDDKKVENLQNVDRRSKKLASIPGSGLKTVDSGSTTLENVALKEKILETSSSRVKVEEPALIQRKTAAEEMADLKRRNKLARRSQSKDLKSASTLDPSKRQNPETGPVCTSFKPFRTSSATSKSKSVRTPTNCRKLVLAMRTPQCALKDCSESLDTTLDVTVRSTRLVGLETLKMLKIDKKEEVGRKVTDRLARYRHLKISYMTVARPRRKKNEKFLPEAVENFEGRQVSEKEKDKILTYRFELLKRLNQEYQQQLNQQLTTKSTCDSSASNQSDMNPTKPALKSDFYDALFSILKAKCTKTKPTTKDPNKTGSTRRYCTDSTKCPGDEQEEQTKVNVCNTIVDNTKVETSDVEEEQLTPPPKCGFEITEAVPAAFEKASTQLQESEQSNLYYKYHKMSFAVLHESLADKRTFAVDAADKKRLEECEKQLKQLSSPKSETEN